MAVKIDLSGEVAVVTGAGSGIGREVSLLIAEAGGAVLVVDLDGASAAATVEQVTAAGGRAVAIVADVTDTNAVARGLADSALGPPTIAVNNAFWARPGAFLKATAADDEKTLHVIVGGTMTVTRAVLPGMVERGAGVIINVMSEAGRVGEPTMVAYSAAKAAVGGFTKALAKEVGRSGVRVNAVSPGTTKTPATTGAVDDETLRRMAKAYPLGRLGEAEDIANAILWLASPMASWITGQILSVSGGYSMI